MFLLAAFNRIAFSRGEQASRMSICSIEWVASLLVLSAFFFSLPNRFQRQIVLAFCNVVFLTTQMPDWAAWVTLAVFVLSGYGVARIVMAHPRRIILVGYLVLLIAAFLVLKRYVFIKVLLPEALFRRAVATVGLSYMLFRQIQVVVDAFQGQVQELTLWNYVNYQINLFGFVAGPIQRYQEFCRSWVDLGPILTDAESILHAYLRIFLGVLKITLVAGLCLSLFESCSLVLGDAATTQRESHGKRILQLLELFYSYPLYIYFNFSGYCDMVIAGAALVGLRMPENFIRPYLSRNMIEFWTRWHRTLGLWIRDYVFTPMYKAIASRWPARAASCAFLCYFVAFFLAGVWHGSTWNCVVYGFLNGLGLAVTKLWENHLIKKHGRPWFRSYLQNPAIRVAAIVTTLNFVCLTIFFFASDLEKTYQIVKNALTFVTKI
jgi:D-alanyl-lipoteichoic acid acyltransferase DltB (MBOAT superfamily)